MDVFAWNTTSQRQLLAATRLHKSVLTFNSKKMKRESVSCSPTEGEKPSRTKVMQSEIKKEDSRSTLCFFFFLRHLADFGNLLLR